MQDRMMIRGTVRTGDGKECRKRALNDIVISRAGFSRLIGLDVYVNGSFLNAYEEMESSYRPLLAPRVTISQPEVRSWILWQD